MAETPTPICTARNATIAASFIVGTCLLSEVVASIRLGLSINKLYSLRGLEKYRVAWSQQFVGIPLFLWSAFAGGRLIRDWVKGPAPQEPPLPPEPTDPPRRLEDREILERVKELPQGLEEETWFDQPIDGVGTILSTSDQGASFRIGETTIELIVGDIKSVTTEAAENAANERLSIAGMSGVVAAFYNRDKEQTNPQYTCGPTYAIRAAGPPCAHKSKEDHGKDPTCPTRLRLAYLSSLELAEAKGVQSIAFPLLGSEIFGYTATKGSSDVALRTMQDYFKDHPDSKITRVQFVSRTEHNQAFVGFVNAVKAHCLPRPKDNKREAPDQDLRVFSEIHTC